MMLLNCSWAPKKWCFLEKTLESLLDCKEIQPVHPKGNQSWVFIGRTDTEAETPILWPSDVKSWLIWKDPDAEKDWGQEEQGMREDERYGWHHWLNGHKFGWTPGVGDGQECLVCSGSWGHKESDMTQQLNWLTDSQFNWFSTHTSTFFKSRYIICWLLDTAIWYTGKLLREWILRVLFRRRKYFFSLFIVSIWDDGW